MFDYFSDEASSPALEIQGRQPIQAQQSEAKDKMMKRMAQLAWLRQGHDGPEAGTRYNLPSQGG